MSDSLANIPLSAIRVFEAAARLLSFTRAAEDLGMSQAAVSWQVKALEQRLDQPLFRRLPREVALTPSGERLARAASEAMGLLRTAIAELSDTGEGVLAISTLQTFAIQWLAPRLGGFQLAQPKIAVRLDSSNLLVDPSRTASTWPSALARGTGRGWKPCACSLR
jgi:LysR family glycine cleavage system transcriptional activator